MPTTSAAHAGVPATRRTRVRALLTGTLFAAWVLVLLYAVGTADDLSERLASLAVLGLGVAAALSAAWQPLRAAQQRLLHAERRIVAMSSSDILPWESDLQGRLTFVGEQAERHFGWTAEELVGTNLAALVHPQEIERLTSYLEAGMGWANERWRCVVRDGREKWFSGSAVPNVAPDGRIVGWVGSALPLGRDAVDQQRLSEIAERVYDRLHGGELLPVFQPILSVSTGRLIGAEGLTRFPGSDRFPDQWFHDAAEVGLGVELELAAVERLLAAAHQLPADLYVSVNVGPQTLVRAELHEVLLSSGIPTDRIVLEVTEHASISKYDAVQVAVGGLRALGVRLAVDDAGAGYASFRHILELSPEIIKLDRSLIAGLNDDPALRALASAVVSFGRELRSTVTAEGIETPAELRCAQDLGIHAAQGYLFGKPAADWSTWREWHARGAVYSVAAAGMSSPAC